MSEENPDSTLLLPCREPFEHGILPLPKLILPFENLLSLKSNSNSNLITPQILSDSLQITPHIAHLVIETLKSVLESDRENDEVDLYDLLPFLYVQGYKRLVLRNSKDAAAVADVWPRVSAFDGCLSAMSQLQLVRSNSRRFIPSQADEEAHQLSYLQKHMANLLTLLADGEDDESLVITTERFKHLEVLIKFIGKSGEVIPCQQAVPLFANSDSAPAAQILDWILQKISTSLEHVLEKSPTKENSSNTTNLDNSMSDTSANSSLAYSRNQTFVEGVSKSSVIKQATDIKGHSVKVLNCHDSVIYILAPLRYALIYGCSESTIVLGAIGKALKVEHCERVQIITAAKRICIANCRECVFFLGVNQQPLIIGDNPKLQLAPYNTYYPELEEHMTQVGINASINKWNEPYVLGMVDPHESLSNPTGISEVQPESATCVDPNQFTNFVIPKVFGAEPAHPTKDNPFPLPESYLASLRKTHSLFSEIQQVIRNAQLEESKKQELACALHLRFKDWLYASGNIRLLYYLQGD